MALATPEHGALETALEILCGPEADLLQMYLRVAGVDRVLYVGRRIGHIHRIGHKCVVPGLFWHAAHARARPRAHPQKNIVYKTQLVSRAAA